MTTSSHFCPAGAAILAIGEPAGAAVSVDQAHACLANVASATEVANHAKAYGEAGINQTPTLVLNGFQLPPEQSEWPKIAEALRAAGSR